MSPRLQRLIGGLHALFRSGRTERELDAELRAYLDASTEEKIRTGKVRSPQTVPGE